MEIMTTYEHVNNFIKQQPNLENGFTLIKSDIANYHNNQEVPWLNTAALQEGYAKFAKWLNELLKTEPLPSEILGINLGISKPRTVSKYISPAPTNGIKKTSTGQAETTTGLKADIPVSAHTTTSPTYSSTTSV